MPALKCINRIINYSFIFIKDNFDAHVRSKRSMDYYDDINLICDPDTDEVSACTEDQIKDNTQTRAPHDNMKVLKPSFPTQSRFGRSGFCPRLLNSETVI